MATLIDVLDKNGTSTGDKKTKQEIHEQGLWHNASWIWIYNSRGEILLQLRAKNKDSHPGQWDISAAGHVDTGETPMKAAIRELNEEIGISAYEKDFKQVDFQTVSSYQPEIGWQNNEFDYIYLFKYDGKISDLKLQEEEVEKMEFIPLEKFEMEINDPETYKKYVPHGEHCHKIIKAIRGELS